MSDKDELILILIIFTFCVFATFSVSDKPVDVCARDFDKESDYVGFRKCEKSFDDKPIKLRVMNNE